MQPKKCPISFANKTDSEVANDLNSFYNCLNTHDFSKELSEYRNAFTEQNEIHVDRDTVCKLFRRVKESKSPAHEVPHLWKDSVCVPVPKVKAPKSLCLQLYPTQLSFLEERFTSIHNIDPGLLCWLVDLLTDRSQQVRDSVSS